MTTACVLDNHSVIGCDKFDNVFIARAPEEVQGDSGGDMSGLRLKADTAYLTGNSPKLEHVMQFHVGETITAIEKAILVPGSAEVLIHATLLGGIGVMYPFTHKEEVDFFQHLEMFLRSEKPPLCGRDHMMYRSYYFPLQGVIDGDMCEQYTSLPYDRQKQLAAELDKTPAEILKKLEDMRNRIL